MKVCKRGHIRNADTIFNDGHCRECRQVRRDELLKTTSFCPKGHLRSYNTVYKNGGCRICAKEYLQRPDIKQKHKKRVRDYILRKTFGITTQDYNVMFSKQNGCCLICTRHQKDLTKRLAVDHSHRTGKIRGLLCSSCNTTLGFFKDDMKIFERAIDYLKEKEYGR